MPTMQQILTQNAGIASAFETKFAFLPKISPGMVYIATKVPTGPDFPTFVGTVLEPPSPAASGQPFSGFFTTSPIGSGGPTLPPLPGQGTTSTTTSKLKLQVSPKSTPGTERGTAEYQSLQVSPGGTPGAQRGTAKYLG